MEGKDLEKVGFQINLKNDYNGKLFEVKMIAYTLLFLFGILALSLPFVCSPLLQSL